MRKDCSVNIIDWAVLSTSRRHISARVRYFHMQGMPQYDASDVLTSQKETKIQHLGGDYEQCNGNR